MPDVGIRSDSDADGAVIWLTGLSGSGKTTVGKVVRGMLLDNGLQAAHLDGDRIRETMPDRGGYTKQERLALAKHYVGLATILYEQGMTVVVSTISLFHEVHALNRRLFKIYVEVLLDVPWDELSRRDSRGIYTAGSSAVGRGIQPEMPIGSDLLRLNNYGDITPEHCAKKIVAALRQKRDMLANDQTTSQAKKPHL
jgi:adenylylsulfate kinase-like enzyme